VWTGVEPGEDHPDHAFSLVTAGGRSSIGSCFVPDEPDPGAITPLLLERARRFIPAIADARLGATRVCARPLSLDERPLVGPIPGVDGLYVAAGHGPWGISTGPAAATLLVDLLDGRRPVPAALDPARFGPLDAFA
jgi:glycine/D-amino acid oxidase-like deaminating enzyme